MDKKELRKIVKEQIAELKPEYCDAAARSIAEQVCGSKEFLEAKVIFAFLSMQGEPQTRGIIEQAWSLGKRVCVPLCHAKPRMEAREIKSFSELATGKYGISEPTEKCLPVRPEEIDLVLVPCVSASKDGRRLGHGAGFYDYYLEKQKAYRMCLCYEKLMQENIPMDEHDLYMDRVVHDYL